MKNAIGGLLFTALFVVGLAVEQSATAANLIHNMGDGDSVQFRCQGGTLSQPQHTGTMWHMKCTRETTEKPPVEKPTQCGDPDLPLYPARPQSLPQQEFVNVHSDRVRVYQFNSNAYSGVTGRISIAPTPKPSGRPSNSNLTVLSECKGFLDVDMTDNRNRACWAAGYQNNISWRIGRTTSSVCGLKEGTTYYLNTSPRNPVTGRDTCGGVCSIVVNSGKQ